MGRKTSAPGAEDILRFYDARGYRNSVGSGQRPAIVVVDFSNAFTRGASQFPGGDFANEMAQTGRLLTVARELGLPVFFTTIAYADPEKESGLWGKKVPWLSCCKLGHNRSGRGCDAHFGNGNGQGGRSHPAGRGGAAGR